MDWPRELKSMFDITAACLAMSRPISDKSAAMKTLLCEEFCSLMVLN